ncbi:MAG: PQQ-binding-like beta-propeller repeat protein [Planctomycetes bacterium]|nr:PQQ-binding-like beta-propeller repeat protein [Planctomycetota bacterium]
MVPRIGFALALLALPALGHAQDAAQILKTTGVKGGLIVHVGCGDGTLTAALHASDSTLVHGLDTDAGNIEKARKHIRSLGLGGKVSVAQWSGDRLPYVDNLVNLLVVSGECKAPKEEMLRVLAPSGVALFVNPQSEIRNPKLVKPRPQNIDEWTHALHGPDNNAVANDEVVAPPCHLQWVAAPQWGRSHDHLASVSAVVSSAGRIFSIIDEGPVAAVALPSKWFLVARDAFSGVLLWKREVRPWEGHLRGFRSGPAELARRLVAVGDRVYVTLGYGKPVSALDAATGKTVQTYEGTENTMEIACQDKTLFLVVGASTPNAEALARAAQDAKKKWAYWPVYEIKPPRKHLMAIRADTGGLLWKKDGPDTAELMPTTLAVSGGRVFYQNPAGIVCLDAQSGKEIWRAARPIETKRMAWTAPTLVIYDDVVLSADRAAPAQSDQADASGRQVQWTVTSQGGNSPLGELIAYSTKTGERLWSCPCRECYNAPVDVFVADGLVWTGNLIHPKDPGFTEGRDPKTGEVKRRRPPDTKFFSVGMGHHRCYRNKATCRYLLLGRAGVEFIDLATGEAIPNHWVRGVCQYGIMPCNGLLYAPPHSCACYIEAKLTGFNALAPKSQRPEIRDQVSERLKKGPAYSAQTQNRKSKIENPNDWPTYRHDPARSGCTVSRAPTRLSRAWTADIGGRLTSPVASGGKVFVASVETHTVYALNAKDGRRVWSRTVGGRVDGPPTIYNGLALFGSADGYVYCLRATDGELAWRFRAAPEDRRLVSYDQVESVWPVPGNVLVEDDVAYFAAGRSSFLDGGITLYGLEAKTGKKVFETQISSRDPETGCEQRKDVRGFGMAGALPDVLSSDGTSIFMRHKRFDRSGVEQKPDVPHLFSSVGFVDDSWWHRTYWLIGTQMRSGWGGWPIVGDMVPAGRLLVFDDASVYGYGRLNQYSRDGSHVGLGNAAYRLFACAKKPKVIKTPLGRPQAKPAGKGAGKRAAKKKKKRRRGRRFKTAIECRWSEPTAIQVRGMVLTDGALFVAGPPDCLAPKGMSTKEQLVDALAAYEGRKGGRILVISPADGKEISEIALDSPPVFDGMIATNNQLVLSTMDGKVVCMSGNP